MIKVKSTVKPKSLVIMAACANVAETLGIEILVTSGNDSKHMIGSKHYEDAGIDVRSKAPFKSLQEKHEFVDLVLGRLGKEYDGFLEADGTANEHFHFEYDPK